MRTEIAWRGEVRRKKEMEERRSTFNYGARAGPEREKTNASPFLPSHANFIPSCRDINTSRGINDSCRVIPMCRYLARSAVSRDGTSQSKIKKFKRPIY